MKKALFAFSILILIFSFASCDEKTPVKDDAPKEILRKPEGEWEYEGDSTRHLGLKSTEVGAAIKYAINKDEKYEVKEADEVYTSPILITEDMIGSYVHAQAISESGESSTLHMKVGFWGEADAEDIGLIYEGYGYEKTFQIKLGEDDDQFRFYWRAGDRPEELYTEPVEYGDELAGKRIYIRVEKTGWKTQGTKELTLEWLGEVPTPTMKVVANNDKEMRRAMRFSLDDYYKDATIEWSMSSDGIKRDGRAGTATIDEAVPYNSEEQDMAVFFRASLKGFISSQENITAQKLQNDGPMISIEGEGLEQKIVILPEEGITMRYKYSDADWSDSVTEDDQEYTEPIPIPPEWAGHGYFRAIAFSEDSDPSEENNVALPYLGECTIELNPVGSDESDRGVLISGTDQATLKYALIKESEYTESPELNEVYSGGSVRYSDDYAGTGWIAAQAVREGFIDSEIALLRLPAYRQVDVPYFEIRGDGKDKRISIYTADENAEIHYLFTFDDTESVTKADSLYSDPIEIPGDYAGKGYIKARAYKKGYDPSDMGIEDVPYKGQLEIEAQIEGSGTEEKIVLTSDSIATITYTLTAEPQSTISGGSVYSAPVAVPSNLAGEGYINAVATAPGWVDSRVISYPLPVFGTVDDPTISFSGTGESKKIAITCPTSGATIKYAYSSVDPEAEEWRVQLAYSDYSSSLSIPAQYAGTGYIIAVATKTGYESSDPVIEAIPTYGKLELTLSIVGSYMNKGASASCSTPGASIYYKITTNSGASIAKSDKLYSSAYYYSTSEGGKGYYMVAKAFKQGWDDSDIKYISLPALTSPPPNVPTPQVDLCRAHDTSFGNNYWGSHDGKNWSRHGSGILNDLSPTRPILRMNWDFDHYRYYVSFSTSGYPYSASTEITSSSLWSNRGWGGTTVEGEKYANWGAHHTYYYTIEITRPGYQSGIWHVRAKMADNMEFYTNAIAADLS